MILLSAFFLTACGTQSDADKKETSSAAPAEAPEKKEDVAAYDPDKGLYLPKETLEQMGVKTGVVQKTTFHAEQTTKFQIFREAQEHPLPGMPYCAGYAYGSALISSDKINLIKGQAGFVSEKEKASVKLVQLNTWPNLKQTEVLVEIADPRNQFILGNFCLVHWQQQATQATTVVPESALLKTTEGDFVYLKKADRFVRTAVKLGVSGEGQMEITEGASVGDVVVNTAVQTLWLTELKLKAGGGEP